MEEVLELIGQDKLTEAIELLIDISSETDDLLQDLILLKSRLNHAKNSHRQGIIKAENLEQEVNKIRLALIELTFELKEEGIQIEKDNSKPGITNESKVEKDKREKIFLDQLIRVGYFNCPPFASLKSGAASPTGVYIKIMEGIAAKNSLNIDWQLINLSEAVKSIVEDKIDVYLSIFQTPRRNKHTAFISFLHSVGVNGIVKEGFPQVNSLKELRRGNFKYVVCKDEVGEEILEDILKVSKSQEIIIDTNKISSIVPLVQSGYVDIALAASLSCHEFMKQNPDCGLRLIDFKPPIAMYNVGFMIAQNKSAFSDWLEKEIDVIVNNEDFIQYEEEQLRPYNEVIYKIQ